MVLVILVPPPCSVFIATSLDGFIARTDGRIDWLSIVERPAEDYDEEFSSETPETLVHRLADRGAKRIYVDGGTIIRGFMAAKHAGQGCGATHRAM